MVKYKDNPKYVLYETRYHNRARLESRKAELETELARLEVALLPKPIKPPKKLPKPKKPPKPKKSTYWVEMSYNRGDRNQRIVAQEIRAFTEDGAMEAVQQLWRDKAGFEWPNAGKDAFRVHKSKPSGMQDLYVKSRGGVVNAKR